MHVIYEYKIHERIKEIVKKAEHEGKKIEKILLNRAEYTDLLQSLALPPDSKIDVVSGVKIERSLT